MNKKSVRFATVRLLKKMAFGMGNRSTNATHVADNLLEVIGLIHNLYGKPMNLVSRPMPS